MEKKNPEISFFKQKILLWKLKHGQCVSQDDLRELILSVSNEVFGRYALFILSFADEATLSYLLEAENEEKFDAAVKCANNEHTELFYLIWHKASIKQANAYISNAEISGSRLYDILSRFGTELLSSYLEKYTLPTDTASELICREQVKMVTLFFQKADVIFISEKAEDVLLGNPCFKQIRELYIEKADALYENGRVYALEYGTFEKAKKVVSNYVLKSDKELKALTKRNEPELFITAVKTLNSAGKDNYHIFAAWFNGDIDHYLINSGVEEAIRLYLPSRELSECAEISLSKLGNEELFSLYLRQGVFSKKGLVNQAEEILFETGSEALKKLYAEKYGLSYRKERELILSNDTALIRSYIEKRPLRLANVIKFAEKALGKDLLFYVEKHGFSELLETYLMLRGKPDSAEFYVQSLILKDKRLCSEAESVFIRHYNKEIVLAYIENLDTPLCTQAESLLLKREDRQLIASYLEKFCFSEGAVSEFVKVGSLDMLRLIFEKQHLSAEVEAMLIDDGLYSVLHVYTGYYQLDEVAERAFVQKDTSQAILRYINTYELSLEAEKELIKRGCKRLIETYLDRYDLFEDNAILYAAEIAKN